MSVYQYKKYKVALNKDAVKIQGLECGDIVRRQYFDGANTVYSLLCVLYSGVDDDNKSYFVGALIDGDEPKNGELLDFIRVTNLFNEDRQGAIYLTSSDNNAPYLDIIDGIGKNTSLCYPNSESQYHIDGAKYVTSQYAQTEQSNNRIITLTKNSLDTKESIGLKQSFLRYITPSNKVLISYKIKANRNINSIVTIGYADGDKIDGSVNSPVTTEWEYKFHVISIDYSGRYLRALTININDNLLSGDFVSIADLNVILLSNVANFQESSQSRFGKIDGITDAVFGDINGYGGYLKRLYASQSVNISGTITAGDSNGFASTFYAGKIHKNAFINSIAPSFLIGGEANSEIKSPTGAGLVYSLASNSKLFAQTKDWANKNSGKQYILSFWIYALQSAELSVTCSDVAIKNFDIRESEVNAWKRYNVPFSIISQNNDLVFDLSVISDGTVLFSSPQLEEGEYVTLYQPTDEVLCENDEYGAWMNRGGIGGTIQNPLLQFHSDGSISTRLNTFAINKDASGYIAGGKIKWDAKSVVLKGVTSYWEDLDGKKTVINGNTVVTPKIFAGNCSDTNQLTGVYMGEMASSTGIFGYKDGQDIFHIDNNGALIGGWNITKDGIESTNNTLKILSTGSIVAVDSDNFLNIIWGLFSNGSASFSKGNVIFDANGSASFNGKITSSSGVIGGWNINAGRLSSKNICLDGDNNYIAIANISNEGETRLTDFHGGVVLDSVRRYITVSKSSADSVDDYLDEIITNGGVAMYYTDDSNYGLFGYKENIKSFSVGSENFIGGWNFDNTAIYIGNKSNAEQTYTDSEGAITIGTKGLRGNKWFIDANGEVSLGEGIIKLSQNESFISGWKMSNDSLSSSKIKISNNASSSGIYIGNTTSFLNLTDQEVTEDITIHGGIFLANKNNNAELSAFDSKGNIYFSLSGSDTSKISNWFFDKDAIYCGVKQINSGAFANEGSITISPQGVRTNSIFIEPNGDFNFGKGAIVYNKNNGLKIQSQAISIGTNQTLEEYINEASTLGENILIDSIQYTKDKPYLLVYGYDIVLNQEFPGIYFELGDTCCLQFRCTENLQSKGCNFYLYGDSYISADNIIVTELAESDFLHTMSFEIDTPSNYYINLETPSDLDGKSNVWNFKIEKGDKATGWNPAPEDLINPQDLLKTGLDIKNKKIILTADETTVQTNTGKKIAAFTTDEEGNPVVNTECIDAKNLIVKKFKSTSDNDKRSIEIANNQMTAINATGGTALTIDGDIVDNINTITQEGSAITRSVIIYGRKDSAYANKADTDVINGDIINLYTIQFPTDGKSYKTIVPSISIIIKCYYNLDHTEDDAEASASFYLQAKGSNSLFTYNSSTVACDRNNKSITTTIDTKPFEVTNTIDNTIAIGLNYTLRAGISIQKGSNSSSEASSYLEVVGNYFPYTINEVSDLSRIFGNGLVIKESSDKYFSVLRKSGQQLIKAKDGDYNLQMYYQKDVSSDYHYRKWNDGIVEAWGTNKQYAIRYRTINFLWDEQMKDTNYTVLMTSSSVAETTARIVPMCRAKYTGYFTINMLYRDSDGAPGEYFDWYVIGRWK